MGKYIYLFSFLLFYSLWNYAQNPLDRNIVIEPGYYSVMELLSTLSSAGVKLAYSSDQIPDKRIDITSTDNTVDHVLTRIRKRVGIQFKVKDQLIMLSYDRKMYTINGSVTDTETGEALIGASISTQNDRQGTTTNSYGFYSLTLPEGTYEFTISYVGYKEITKEIHLNQNVRFIAELTEKASELKEVTISSMLPDFNIQNLTPGMSPISFGEGWPIPYFLGEEDIFQNSLLLPGIRSIGEDATGLNVRGGDIDQNLILLDEAPIYNPNHFYGLISVFNPEVISNVEIMKGFFPPQYGGRASSVINIIQREGNDREFHVSGGVGLVSARLTAEGPIKKEKASFIVSARRSLVNFSIEDFLNETLDDSRTNFFDLNTKVSWDITPTNKVFLSAYFGQDKNRAGFDAIRKWGNRSVSLRWKHLFGPRLFSNLSLILSEYNYQISDPQEVGSFVGRSSIRDYTLKADFGFVANPKHTVNFGLQSTFHKLRPGERRPFDENASLNETILDNEDALETGLYASHEVALSDNLEVLYGARFSLLNNFGPGDVYVYDPLEVMDDVSITDTLRFDKNEVFNTSSKFEPRISLNYKIDKQRAIKGAFTRSVQYLHLISNTVSPSPTDTWKLSDKHIAPTISDHYSLGYYQNFRDNAWESSVEIYYKDITNLIEFKDGADLLFNENLETELIFGQGRSYGAELFIKRNKGRLRGWISYTFSRAEQKFENEKEELEINNGEYFATDFDKRHDLSVTGIYRLSRRVSISANFSYNSGRPITLPVGKFVFDGNIVPHFENRNLGRLNDYHRLDLSLKWSGKKNRNGRERRNQDYWTFTLYNVYARKNIYSYFFRESPENPGETEAIPYSIFSTIIPSVTYNFRF